MIAARARCVGPLLFLALIGLCPAQAFEVRGLFGDHMVLQRDRPTRVFGVAAPHAEVSATAGWLSAPVATKADGLGHWRIELPAGPAGGPHELKLQSGGAERVARDVLLGEVWLCSGQSNMEQRLSGPRGSYHRAYNSEAEIAAAHAPKVRFFSVDRRIALRPEPSLGGAWRIMSPETAPECSAAAWFFGRDLHRELGVPVGLVIAAWGGTRAEAWCRESTLARYPELVPELQELKRWRDSGTEPKNPDAWNRYWGQVGEKDTLSASPGGVPVGALAAIDGPGFEPTQVPTAKDHAFQTFDGIIWFRRDVEVPSAWIAEDLVLELGPIDDLDAAWVEGHYVGGIARPGHFGMARRYPVAGSIVRGTKLRIAVRVQDLAGHGGFAGESAALKIVRQSTGESISLAGSWAMQRGAAHEALGALPEPGLHPNAVAVLSHGMLEPLGPTVFAGAIWYQGESNRNSWMRYRSLFPAMIEDWRARFETPGLPFHFVQIAPFQYGDEADDRSFHLRLAQAEALKLPHTGMVTTGDIGEARDIHPRDKQSIGRRLALSALAGVYGRSGAASGPKLARAERAGQDLILRWQHLASWNELEAVALPGFEIETAPGQWSAAPAQRDVDASGKAVVRLQGAATARAVRYGCAAVPPPPFRNEHGLPAAPALLELR